jgi:hypothetical protein
MSKGTQQYAIRIPPAYIEEIDKFCARTIGHGFAEPMTRSGFIVKAIKERLDKLERGRRKKRYNPEQDEESLRAVVSDAADLVAQELESKSGPFDFPPDLLIVTEE